MKLFLLRHGEAIVTPEDTVLSDFGHKEAKELSEKLKEIPIDKIYVSDLTRAQQTLKPFKEKKPKIPIVETEDLREIYRVIVGGSPKPGTSPGRKERDTERAEKMWEIFKKEKGNIAVFCHGNIIRFFIMKALNLQPGKLWDQMLITTCSISVIEINNDLIRVNAINLIEHSPLKKEFYNREKLETTYHP